jgi:hypothetical protein
VACARLLELGCAEVDVFLIDGAPAPSDFVREHTPLSGVAATLERLWEEPWEVPCVHLRVRRDDRGDGDARATSP